MNSVKNEFQGQQLNERLANGGFRFTPQRQHVYEVLMHKRDHPTAEEVFFRARETKPDISLATVYNCLDALVKCGLVKQVSIDRGATRFCPNMHEHCHFHCEQCGGVYDIDLGRGEPAIPMPRGFKASHYEVAIHGSCPACAGKKQ